MATQTTIVYEIGRLQKLTLAKMFLDAKACYDRIVMSLANIASRSQGLHQKLTKLYENTLTNMKYYPKHQLGISKKPNGHMKDKPFHGAGQGSGDGGTRWGHITDKMIKVYNKTCKRTTIKSPTSNKEFTEGVRMFVDDASLLMTGKTQEN